MLNSSIRSSGDIEYTFVGEVINNEITGIGYIMRENDMIYEGEFLDGIFHG